MSVNINTVDTASQAAGQWSGASFDTEISDAELTVTRAAGDQLAALFAQVEDDEYEAIRIYVAGGGCSGMTYGMTYTGERNPYDKVLKGDGYSIYVDAFVGMPMRGIASAQAYILAIVVIVMSFLQFATVSRRVHYQ